MSKHAALATVIATNQSVDTPSPAFSDESGAQLQKHQPATLDLGDQGKKHH